MEYGTQMGAWNNNIPVTYRPNATDAWNNGLMSNPMTPAPGMATDAWSGFGDGAFNYDPAAAGAGQFGSSFSDKPGWFGNLGESLSKYGQTIGQVGQGLGALYGAYNASKQLGLMRDNLRFQKEAYGQNMANSIQSYNTALTDRINGRTANYAGKEADVAAYLAANSLKTVAPTKKKK